MLRESIYKRYQISITPPVDAKDGSYWFLFRSSRLLLQVKQNKLSVPFLTGLNEVNLSSVRTQYLGTFDDRPCYSAELTSDSINPEGMSFYELRSLWGVLDEDLYILAGRALQIVSWDQANQYCGQCGHPTINVPGERARKCPECGLLFYPRLSPAVITAIIKDKHILLGNRAGMRGKMYTVIAGFVEPGETLEECLRREIFEEVGVRVKNLKYFGSQPWPYPNSLMIGFTAEWESGEISVDGIEVSDAGWYDAHHIPVEIPPKLSIARDLIDWFVNHNSN
jgi:NAD+ diphosphatase